MARLLVILILVLTTVQITGQSIKLVGKASFYANKFDGRLTASGEIFSNQKMTAAHRTLPFGTKVLVTNLSNDRTVLVTINDRGPFIRGRVIDVSQKAAKTLGFYQQGITEVKLEIRSSKTEQDSVLQKQLPLPQLPFKIEYLPTPLVIKAS